MHLGVADPVQPGHISRGDAQRSGDERQGPLAPRRWWNGPLGRGLAVSTLLVAFGPAPLAGQDAGSVETWIDLEVRIFQEFLPGYPEIESGHWTVSYRQTGPVVLRLNETSGEGIFRALGTLAAGGRGPSLSEAVGSAIEICEDGHRDRYTTDYEPPLQVEPGTLSVTGGGAEVHLWYSVPIVEMYHPGHGHIPVRSECHTTDPGMTELWLFTSDLEAAGAQANDYGEFLISTLPWEDLVAASQGRREPLPVHANLRAEGISFEVRGTLGARDPGR
jgi:hypothetical protein